MVSVVSVALVVAAVITEAYRELVVLVFLTKETLVGMVWLLGLPLVAVVVLAQLAQAEAEILVEMVGLGLPIR